MQTSATSLKESAILLLTFFVTVVLTLYFPDNLAISIANFLSRPMPTSSPYSPDTLQYHLQESSQDATKTPACACLYVFTSTLYIYTVYLLVSNRIERQRKRYMDYELLCPL